MYLSCLKVDSGESGGVETVGAKWLKNRYRVHQRLCMAFPKESRLKADPDFLAPFTPADFPLLRAEAGQSKEEAGVQQLAQVHAARGAETGFLFRIDPSGGGMQIIVQSATAPNWSYAFGNFRGVLSAEPQVRPFAPSFSRGQRLQFRLEANPTRCVDSKTAPDGTRRRGRRVPVAAADCVEWLRRFQRDGGFTALVHRASPHGSAFGKARHIATSWQSRKLAQRTQSFHTLWGKRERSTRVNPSLAKNSA
jgi:hypothetical protein